MVCAVFKKEIRVNFTNEGEIMDEADKTFKWACNKCGSKLEETDLGMLEVRRQRHKCKEPIVAKCGRIE